MRFPVLLLSLALLACNRTSASKPAEAPTPEPAPSGGQKADLTVAGKVLERIDAGPYSYLRLATKDGERWAAVPKCELKEGDEAVVSNAMAMDGFESKTLNRKFARIVFGTLQGADVHPAAPSAPPPASPHGQMGDVHAKAATPAADLGPIAVRRATGPNAVTVAEAYAKKTALKDKSVSVRAKVVKVLPNIMGKNWVHVRDGSGSAEKKDHDLTVTTDDVVTVGAVVVVRGTLHTDKSLGGGYDFPVIVEDAEVKTD